MPIPACLVAGSLAASAPTAATIAAIPVAELRGRGAAVPFTEYEAENACSTGTVIGPSRALYSIAAEASGRRAVRLDAPGQFVEFTLAKPANAVTVRYAIPDSADGAGQQSSLNIEVAGKRIGALSLTSRYSWHYGAYPFTNEPGDGRGHHVFDEARLLLGKLLPAGTKVRLRVGPQDRSAWYVVDLADFELVPPPLRRPEGALSATQFGADPTGRADSTSAFVSAIAAAGRQHRPLWVGSGNFQVSRHLFLDRVTMTGAGPWYSVLRGRGVGLYGRVGSSHVHLAHFAVIGDVTERNDHVKLAGVGGSLGGGSTIDDLWLQHHKSGVWLDGPLQGVSLTRLRILDNSADGINLRRGVTHARIENVFGRNSGDDGIALWSHYAADADDVVDHDTVVAPALANGIAVYGGHGVRVSGNVVADTLTQGGGIHLGNRFDAVPLSGRIVVTNNLLVRSGSYDPNWKFGVGALWFYALDRPIDADIRVSGTEILDSTISAIQFLGKPIRAVEFIDTTIDGASTWLQVQAAGRARFSRLDAEQADQPGFTRCDASFQLRIDAANGSLAAPSTALCGPLSPAFVERRLAR